VIEATLAAIAVIAVIVADYVPPMGG